MDGHGTHVAGTIGQLTNNNVGVAGMASNACIMPVKVIDSFWDLVFNSPFVGTDDTVARGVRYAVDNGAKVLNLSIGRSGPPAPVVEDAIRYAVSRGAFVAVAGGNEFLRGLAPQRLAEFAPSVDGMVAVGAVGRDKPGPLLERRHVHRADGARRRLHLRRCHLRNPPANLRPGSGGDHSGGVSRYRAPRFELFAYFYFTGTSMATPHVAGFAALLMQQGITSPAAIEAIMKQFATSTSGPRAATTNTATA